MFKLSNYFKKQEEQGTDGSATGSLIPDGTENTPPENTPPESTPPEQASKIERPSWLPEKFKDAESMSASYAELEKKFGGFAGAPEGDYAINLPGDSGTFAFFESEEGSIKQFAEMAKQEGMSQGTFDKMVDFYVKSRSFEDGQHLQQVQKDSLEMVGGVDRFNTISAKAKAAMPEEDYKLLQLAASTSTTAPGAVIKLIEKYVLKGETNPLGSDNINNAPKHTKGDLETMMKDPKYKSDPDFRKTVSEGFKALYPDK